MDISIIYDKRLFHAQYVECFNSISNHPQHKTKI